MLPEQGRQDVVVAKNVAVAGAHQQAIAPGRLRGKAVGLLRGVDAAWVDLAIGIAAAVGASEANGAVSAFGQEQTLDPPRQAAGAPFSARCRSPFLDFVSRLMRRALWRATPNVSSHQSAWNA